MTTHQCLRCGWTWQKINRGPPTPRECPACHNPYWQTRRDPTRRGPVARPKLRPPKD